MERTKPPKAKLPAIKAPKEKKFAIQVLNIKLLSNDRSGSDAYADILTSIFNDKIIKPVKGGKQAILRTQFKTEIKGKTVIYGKFSKFTKIEGEGWLNLNNMEVQSLEIPKHLFPNLVESDYIFIPDAHRLAIIKTDKIQISSVYTFFLQAVKDVIASDEDFQVIIEQSSDIFDEIINAPHIYRLEIDISYSNHDIYKEASEFMDDEIRSMNAKKLKLIVTPDHRQQLSLNSEILKGALGVAKSNGEVKALIKDSHSHRKTIITKDHPETLPLKAANEDQIKSTIFDKIMNMFRNDNQ